MTGATILGAAGPTLGADEAAFFREADPWGFILFARNVATPEALRRLAGGLRDSVGRDAPILVDQEGGRVQRLGAPHWRVWRPPLDQCQAARDPVRAMWIRGRLIAHELRDVGIDVNCAPTADVARDGTHPFLRNRCYATSPGDVSALARAVAEGQSAGGVLAVVKHMPGHGRARVDSHLDLPRVTAPPEALVEDFAPFHALRDLPMGMTAHIVFEALGDRPATQDPAVIAMIRDTIGFDGLLMTDDISMQALGGEMTARAEAAVAAGCDLVLHCNGDRAEMEAVVAAAGVMGTQAEARAAAALRQRRAPEPVDIDALEAELSGLLDGRVYG